MVVEGVARSLNPHINIWQVARPVVEDYIRQSIGPRAVLRDLAKTARVLSRFGPRLPQLVERALVRQSEVYEPERKKPVGLLPMWIVMSLIGGALLSYLGMRFF